MSILQADLPGASVVDLFAGSGALGLEALSRGASTAVFVEIAPMSLRTLHENIAVLGAEAMTTVRRVDALRFAEMLPPAAFDVAFADPPYRQGAAARLASIWQRNAFARVLGVEHRVDESMPAGGDERRYGTTVITFYRADHIGSGHGQPAHERVQSS